MKKFILCGAVSLLLGLSCLTSCTSNDDAYLYDKGTVIVNNGNHNTTGSRANGSNPHTGNSQLGTASESMR